MTTQELQNHIVTIRWNGYGAYKVTIEYRNKNYSCLSHNSMAYDAYNRTFTFIFINLRKESS